MGIKINLTFALAKSKQKYIKFRFIIKNNNTMTNEQLQQKRQENYDEARMYCEMYINYKGDKRRWSYKQLQRNVLDLWIGRLNNFAKILGLPNYNDLWEKA